jgi:hypothetical protein
MAYDSTAQLHNSILVAMQCAAALMLTLIAATALKACGVLEDRSSGIEAGGQYCWEAFGQDLRCVVSFSVGAILCHYMDTEGRRSDSGISSAKQGLYAALI